MKKFDFRLSSVLRLRETQLTVQKNQLQQLFAERAKLVKNLTSSMEERRASEGWIQSTPNATSSDLRALSAFLLGSRSRETMLERTIESCDTAISEQRRRTLLAERNQKLLLNLRDKQKAGWQAAFDKELEEVAQEAWQSAARSKQLS